jgi:Amt family ammonium transporter
MVRKKNVLATLMQSFACCCLVTILWWVIGYSWAFTPGNGFLGGTSRALFSGMSYIHGDAGNKLTVSHLALTIPETVYAMFQMTFAIITPALIAGAFADRMKFSAMLIFLAVWSLVVYSPIAHMVWEPTGWLNAGGVLDYAGGTVVHINAGVAGLASCLVLGKRLGYGKEAMPPYNLTLTLIGASLLWVGWFGFNAGSAVAADGRAGMAMLATQMATGAAALAWMFAEWVSKGKPSVLGIASGAVAGLVAITPASGFVGPTPAVIIGLVATTRWMPSACTASAASWVHCSPESLPARRSAAWTGRCWCRRRELRSPWCTASASATSSWSSSTRPSACASPRNRSARAWTSRCTEKASSSGPRPAEPIADRAVQTQVTAA